MLSEWQVPLIYTGGRGQGKLRDESYFSEEEKEPGLIGVGGKSDGWNGGSTELVGLEGRRAL